MKYEVKADRQISNKFKISPIFNLMIYYKLEYQVFYFLLSAKVTYRQSKNETLLK